MRRVNHGAHRCAYGGRPADARQATATWIVFDARSPSAYVTVSVTAYVPALLYVCVVLSDVDLLPSPKSQR